MNRIPKLGSAFLTMIFGIIFSTMSPVTGAEGVGAKSHVQQECIEKMVMQPGQNGINGLIVKVKECKITCSGGSTSTTCRENEKCDCECRSSGLPGCSCHPNTRLQDAQKDRRTALIAIGQHK